MKISIEWLKEYVEVPEDPGKLKEDLTISGLVVESVMEMDGDTVLEIEVTSNRPDCLSYVGIAREVAAIYGKQLKVPPIRKSLKIRPDKIQYGIEILDTDLCPRYVGLVVSDLRVGPSPAWMQRRLEAAGMRPVNNIVDITNYVLLELGHPLHAFDLKKLKDSKIIVARAKAGQKIVTLDGVERELDDTMLLINDSQRPVAVAGVMGGLDSEINTDTETVLIESAYFQPMSVRRTSKRLGLSTEASYRFERGADWNGTIPAIARTCYLLEQHAGGRIAGGIQDVYPRKLDPQCIMLRAENVEKLLGVAITDTFIEKTLKRLKFRTARKGRRCWEVTCPTFRADMELEADLIEEIARFFGYQNIPTTLPACKGAGLHSPVYDYEISARRVLLGLGFSESVNLSFANDQEHLKFPPDSGDRVGIQNPLTEETQFLRSSLAPGLVKSAKRNFNHDIYHVRLFEIGRVYRIGADRIPREKNYLGLLGTGGFAGFNWRNPKEDYDYFHLKGAVAAFLSGMHGPAPKIQPATGVSWLNPADASSVILENRQVGVLGSLHPSLQEDYKLRQTVFLAEFDFEELSRSLFKPVRYEYLAKYPAVQRDLSVLISREVSYGDLESGIASLGIAELLATDLIDVYDGEKIPNGKISMTLRFIFQDREATLTVDRIQMFSDNILAFLTSKYGAELRYQL